MKPDQYTNTKEVVPKAEISLVDITPLLTPEQFEKDTEDCNAVVLVVFATGTYPTRLNGVIKKRTDEGIPVFLVSKNYGNNHGIIRIVYEVQAKSLEAGAIPLEKVNVNNIAEIRDFIKSEFANGKKGKKLGESVREHFAYKEGEPKPIPDWENPEKIAEMEQRYRWALKRVNTSDEEIEKEIKRWRGDK